MNARRSSLTRVVPLVLAMVAVVAVAVPALGSSKSASSCDSPPVPYNTWSLLPAPPGHDLEFAAVFSGDRCRFAGFSPDGSLYATSDAGKTWRRAATTASGFDADGLLTEDMAEGTGLLFGKPSLDDLLSNNASTGLYLISDYGRDVSPIPEFSALEVTAAAASLSNSGVIYAAATPLSASVPTLFKTSDGGETWTPLPLSGVAQPDGLIVDPNDSDVVWVESESGLWRSMDGGASFSPVQLDAVNDIDAATLGGGGTRVDVATPDGILRTRDRGTSFSKIQARRPVTAITHEAAYPKVIMAIVGGVPLRSVNEGAAFVPTGLTSIGSCSTDLTHDSGSPSLFLLSLSDCPTAGHYLYLSDGRDIAGQKSGGGLPSFSGLVPGQRVQATPMNVLRRLPLPLRSTYVGESGSVAFDGTRLYFSGDFEGSENSTEKVFMMSPVDGRLIGSFRPYTYTYAPGCEPGPETPAYCRDKPNKMHFQVVTMTYDSTRNALWVVGILKGEGNWALFKVDLRTHHATYVSRPPNHTVAFDPSLGSFVSFEEGGQALYEKEQNGWQSGPFATRCEIATEAHASASPYTALTSQIAGGIPAGDGTFYLQMEDDTTVMHVSRDCETLGVYQHLLFAESNLENDQLACDSVTFAEEGEQAIWIHDANFGMIAYSAPGAYCPVPSRLAVVPERVRSAAHVPTPLCADLSRAFDGAPISGASVRIFVEDHFAGAGLTDAMGKACVTYTPTERPGSRLDVHASFLGNVSYKPSQADGLLSLAPVSPSPTVSRLSPTGGVVALIAPPPPPPLPVIDPAPAPGAAPVSAPAPAPAQAPAQAQASNPQAMAVTQRQEQPQIAFVHAASRLKEQASMQNAMSRTIQHRSDPLAAAKFALSMSALSVMLLYGFASATAHQVRTRRVRR